MGSFIEFAEVTGAILLAVGLALAVEWAALYGITSLMPLKRNSPSNDRSRSITL